MPATRLRVEKRDKVDSNKVIWSGVKTVLSWDCGNWQVSNKVLMNAIQYRGGCYHNLFYYSTKKYDIKNSVF